MNSKSPIAASIEFIVMIWHMIHARAAFWVLVLVATALFTNFFGTIAVEWDSTKHASLTGLIDLVTGSAYESTQATLMSMSPHRDKSNGLLIIGRVAAVLLTFLVAIEGIGRLFKSSFRGLRMTWSKREKVLVCGLGRIGYHKTKQLIEEGKQVLVIEKANRNHWTVLAEKAGAIVFQGDVTDVVGLKEHVRRGPEEIYLVTGDDHSNITALANIRSLKDECIKAGKALSPIVCYLHITDGGLEQEVRRSQIERDANSEGKIDSVQVKIFNIFAQTARQLITEKLAAPNIRPRRHDEVALYVVCGFGQMGKAMVREIAEHAHFDNRKRSRILVLTPDAETECDNYLARWGRLSPRVVCQKIEDVRFDKDSDSWASRKARPLPACQVEAPEAVEYVANVTFCEFSGAAVSSGLIEELVRLTEEPGVRPAMLFCFDEGEQNFKLANQLNEPLQSIHGVNNDLSFLQRSEVEKQLEYKRHEEFHLPLFVFLPRSGTLCSLFSCSQEKYPLVPFGDVGEGMQRTFDESIEEVAMEIAASYERNTNGEPYEGRDEYMPIWRKKNYWDRSSNLSAAEHAFIKVKLLGFELIKDGCGSSLNPNEVTREQKAMLGLVEHNRWMAERLMMGWCYGPRSSQPPQRPSLCDKSILPADELVKDFEQVVAVVNFWMESGYRLEMLQGN